MDKDCVVIAQRENESLGGYIALGILLLVIGVGAGILFIVLGEMPGAGTISIIIGIILCVGLILLGVKQHNREEQVVLYDQKNDKLYFSASKGEMVPVDPSNIKKARSKMSKTHYTTYIPRAGKTPLVFFHSLPSGYGKLKVKLISPVMGHSSFSYSRVVDYFNSERVIYSIASGQGLKGFDIVEEGDDEDEGENGEIHESVEGTKIENRETEPLGVESSKSTTIGSRETGINFDGDLTISSYAEIDGNVRCTGNLKINSSVNVSGYVSCDGNLSIGSYCEIDGNVKAKGNVSVQSSVNIGGNINAGGDVSIGSYVEIEGPIIASGNIKISSSVNVGDGIKSKGTLVVSPYSEVNGVVNVGGDADISGEIGDDVSCKGDFVLRPYATINGNAKIGGNAEINGDIDGDLSVGKDVKISSNGRINGDLEYQGHADIDGEVGGDVVKVSASPKQEKKGIRYERHK